MTIRSYRRLPARTVVAVLALLSLLVVVLAPPADARSSSSYRITGRSADTYWTQVDGTPPGSNPFGNVHVGWLYADETTNGTAAVFGWIDDFDCEPGSLPGGGHGVAKKGCKYVGSRFIEAYDVPFTMDRKLSSARLTGQLTVYGGGHGEGGVVGRPMADVTWTGIGDLASERWTSRWREGGTWYSDSYRSKTRAATMGGIIGPMGFDPELSGGTLASYRSASRSRTK